MRFRVSILTALLLLCVSAWSQGYKVYGTDGKVYAYPGSMVEKVTLNDDSLSYDGHEYVDLGLPSGIRWASVNIGAEKEHHSGKYITHKAYSNGSKWGGDWHLPCYGDWLELQNHCKWEWDRIGLNNGYKVTGPNGNSIFLPAAGRVGTGGLQGIGLTGTLGLYMGGESDFIFFKDASQDVLSLVEGTGNSAISVRPVIGTDVTEAPNQDVVQTDEYEFVDMGTSVLWATKNIGAKNADEAGSYFGPGMIEPTDPNQLYNNSGYRNDYERMISDIFRWSYVSDYYDEEDYQKWSQEQVLGPYTNCYGSWLLPEHDAAHAQMGGGWRIPSYNDFKELAEKCEVVSATKSAITFRAKNGSVLTIPSVYCYSSTGSRITSGFYYRTSSLKNRYHDVAWLYPMVPNLETRYYSESTNGIFAIRPVKDKANTSKPVTVYTDTTAEQSVDEMMVDLGLSVMWSSCNWGADDPHDAGRYSAYLETYQKDQFLQSNYRGNINAYGVEEASVMFGNREWAVPTAAQFAELKDKCTWEREEGGYKITGPSGKSIFMPFTGVIAGKSLSCQNSAGYYRNADGGTEYFTAQTKPEGKKLPAYLGMAIRPVMGCSCPVTLRIQPKALEATVDCLLPSDSTLITDDWTYADHLENCGLEIGMVPMLSSASGNMVRTSQESVYLEGFARRFLITGLQPNTVYYYRPFILQDGNRQYGQTRSFRTSTDIPAVDLGLSVKWADFNYGYGLGSYTVYGGSFTSEEYYSPVFNNQEGRYDMPCLFSYEPESLLCPGATLGDEWRLPTEAEFQELLDKCTWEWEDNCQGYLVTGPNGSSIRMPAAGELAVDTNNYNVSNVVGMYWTQTPHTKHKGWVSILKFTPTDRKITYGHQSYKYSIRPVKN